MAQENKPQIYLITPTAFELSEFARALGAVLDGAEIACVRLALTSDDESQLAKAADHLRELCHSRDTALVIENHIQMVEPFGLDGVHLNDNGPAIRKLRKEFGPDTIIGAHCGTTRHNGMNAAEAGADYIAFGPVTETLLGTGEVAEPGLFQWWSEMIEVPIVAEGGLDQEIVETLAPFTDFFGVGGEIWAADDPVAALSALLAPIG